MNCDEAFDALTDPSRRDCEPLRWHLDLCPRCRQMREVLAPALDLFGPTAEENPADVRPAAAESAAPFLTPDAVQLAERTARRMTRGPVRRLTSRRYAGALMRYVSVFALGVLLAFGIVAAHLEPDGGRSADLNGQSLTRCSWQNPDDLTANSRPSSQAVISTCIACHID